jgi:hypothetical protein
MGAGWVQWTRRICCSPSQLPDSANQVAEEIITLLWHKDLWHWLFYTDINTLRGGYWFNSTANILSPCGIGKFKRLYAIYFWVINPKKYPVVSL